MGPAGGDPQIPGFGAKCHCGSMRDGKTLQINEVLPNFSFFRHRLNQTQPEPLVYGLTAAPWPTSAWPRAGASIRCPRSSQGNGPAQPSHTPSPKLSFPPPRAADGSSTPLALGDGSREDPGSPSEARRWQEGILILTSGAN